MRLSLALAPAQAGALIKKGKGYWMKKDKKEIIDAAADEGEKRIITAKIRSRIYHLLSQVFLYPNEGSYALFKNGFAEELRNSISYLLLNYPKEAGGENGRAEEILNNLESLDKEIKRL